jgi:hypothetical protein
MAINGKRPKIHIPSSPPNSGLLRIPLLHQALTDPQVTLRFRANDSGWLYEKMIPSSASGFNPFQRSIYVNRISSVAEWLSAGAKADRKFNEGDFLSHEALFIAHDYLHVWATMFIQSELPRLGFGHGKIRSANFEDMAFCHLITEAAATVGLDYWFLSTIDCAEYTGIGTNARCLTVSYYERDRSEYLRFEPRFQVQKQEFFDRIASFYCTGEFSWFGVDDLRQSAKLHRWMKHELSYGERQREYTRAWLSHLSDGNVELSNDELSKPIKINQKWQRDLIRNLGEALWNKVKRGRLDRFRGLPSLTDTWRAGPKRVPDLRFTNFRRLTQKELSTISSGPYYQRTFAFYFLQFVSSYRFNEFPPDLLPVLEQIRAKSDMNSLASLFLKLKLAPLQLTSDDPTDLFLPG